MIDLDELQQKRLEKATRLREIGINPYPLRSKKTHTAAEAKAEFESLKDKEITLAGRLMSIRDMGKSTFAHMADQSGRIQLYFKLGHLPEEQYSQFKKTFDLGDFIQATGILFQTHTGEITLQVHGYEMLAKALNPLPEKWHGLTDVEKRYRQRYVDLIVNEPVRDVFVKRSKIISSMRDFLDERGFLEVETPVLQPIYGGAAARPFVTYHNALDQQLYLRIAFELYLKRLIVGGIERVYEIGRDFRNEGISTRHNPEFTMMELYQAYADYNDIMELVEQMYAYIAQEVLGTLKLTYGEEEIDLTPPWPRVTLRDAIQKYAGVDYTLYGDAKSLYHKLDELGIRAMPGLTRAKLIDELLSNFVEPKLIQPTFLIDYPVELSPFAKKKPDDPATVERFEAYMMGIEVGNAFTELNDPIDQAERFLQQAGEREAGDEEAHQMDEDFVTALMYGMPPTGGLGIGIDRTVMLLTNQPSIRDVILFPQLRTR